MNWIYCAIYMTLLIIIIVAIMMKHWETLIAAGPPQLILFYRKDCPFCEAFMPEWDKLQGSKIDCAEVSMIDVAEQPLFAKKRGVIINKVPSVYFFPFGDYRSFEEYTGPRQADYIKSWLYKRLNAMGICNKVIPELPY